MTPVAEIVGAEGRGVNVDAKRHAGAKKGTGCLAEGSRHKDQIRESNLQSAQVGDAGFHQVQVHFDEVIFYAGGFCRGKDLVPIERVLTDRHDLFFLPEPALYVHGNEAAGVPGEIFGGIVAAADGGDLELELDQL